MEKEKANYILNYFSHLMTIKEKAAWKHWTTHYKIENGEFESERERKKRIKFSYYAGWLTNDKEILKLLQNGIDEFREKTAERILKEENINFNNCPKCGKLTRTPKAKQCRHCGHDWH